jgi:subtilisin-like proprotein convertase family protein
LNIEHSYAGDLDIKIISPDGQEVILFNQAGFGTYLGGANDDGSNDPGVGADYCFSMDATTLLQDGNTILAGNPPRSSWEPGAYLPAQSFDQLLGTSLNGEWCIQILDNLSIDNGYIFSWELNFDSNIQLEDYSFVPTISSQSWDTDSSITDVNGNVITVAPSGSGEYCYTFRTVDVLGCEYTEDVCITVADQNQAPVTYYRDSDGDGFGDLNNTLIECSSIPPNGFVLNNLDCDDLNDLINPNAVDDEGNNIDENCDGVDGNALGVNEFANTEFSVQPNPFNSTLVVNMPKSMVGLSFDVHIYDINGRVVYSNLHSNLENEIKILNLHTLKKAVYFLKISNEDNGFNTVKRIIKM